MAKLMKTTRRKAYIAGKAGGRSTFKLLEEYGVKARTVRRFKNDEKEGGFNTVELTKTELLDILENLETKKMLLEEAYEEIEELKNKLALIEHYELDK